MIYGSKKVRVQKEKILGKTIFFKYLKIHKILDV